MSPNRKSIDRLLNYCCQDTGFLNANIDAVKKIWSCQFQLHFYELRKCLCERSEEIKILKHKKILILYQGHLILK